jgi:hypothetical protein
MTDLNAFPQFPDCMFCHGTGVIHVRDFAPHFRFCTCAAGVKRQFKEPTLIDLSNRLDARLGVANEILP